MPVPGIPTEILVAPDSFKGTLSATEVAGAVGKGLTEAGREVALCPLADGGEGTLDALAGALGLELATAEVSDPLGRPITAQYGIGDGVALVEVAAASGFSDRERDPVAASSRGTGELISVAVAAGARTVYLAAGGSATTDGGAGALEVIDEPPDKLIVLCDVRTEFQSAAEVFAPQKGASPPQVEQLTERLEQLATGWPRDPRGVPMSGAAGGLAGGLWAALGAELKAGAPFVLETLGFDQRMRAARAVVVGEGRLDRQTLAGKLAGEVATRARQAGVPCYAVVGENALDGFDTRILDLQMVLEASTPGELQAAGVKLAEII
ncbi:MAG: glycerate kinase [Solirubrobacterales bacterium]|nr:glycerate kinase [Solirubrobacterales bacterium]